jgi:hypothetical protein
VEGAQSSLQSATQRGRHRGQSHLQRPVDRLHLIVRLKAGQLLGGLADIAVVDVSQEASITTRHTIVSLYSKVRSRGCLRGLHPH